MANTYSALKRARQIERRTRINRIRKTRLRHQIRVLRRTLDQISSLQRSLPALKEKEAAEARQKLDQNVAAARNLLPATVRLIDRAAKWGIITRNTAARYKSRLDRRLKTVAAA